MPAPTASLIAAQRACENRPADAAVRKFWLVAGAIRLMIAHGRTDRALSFLAPLGDIVAEVKASTLPARAKLAVYRGVADLLVALRAALPPLPCGRGAGGFGEG